MDMDKGKRMLQEREENPSEIPLTKSRNSQILHWQYILRNLSEKKNRPKQEEIQITSRSAKGLTPYAIL